jgi:hypothetical protein
MMTEEFPGAARELLSTNFSRLRKMDVSKFGGIDKSSSFENSRIPR